MQRLKNLSRQRRYQLKRIAEGKCPRCGNPLAAGMACCEQCAVKMREATRRRRGSHIRRHFNSPSYKAAADAATAAEKTGETKP